MNKKKQTEFLLFLNLCKKRYSKKKNLNRLAAEGWKEFWQVLISTILSAQNKDKNTIVVSENLFKKYTLKKLSKAKYKDVFKIIKSINYNKTKTKNIILTSKILVEKYNSIVPNTIEKLLEFPGVGRKTSNLVLGECFKIPSICVDTHVHRISNVCGFVKTKNRDDTEFSLMKICPKNFWIDINKYFVRLGQEVTGNNKEKFWEKIK